MTGSGVPHEDEGTPGRFGTARRGRLARPPGNVVDGLAPGRPKELSTTYGGGALVAPGTPTEDPEGTCSFHPPGTTCKRSSAHTIPAHPSPVPTIGPRLADRHAQRPDPAYPLGTPEAWVLEHGDRRMAEVGDWAGAPCACRSGDCRIRVFASERSISSAPSPWIIRDRSFSWARSMPGVTSSPHGSRRATGMMLTKAG